MLKSLHSLVFKQADCKVVTMRRFIESDVKMLSEEGPVRVFIYTNSADKALGISKGLHNEVPRVGQMKGLQMLYDGIRKAVSASTTAPEAGQPADNRPAADGDPAENVNEVPAYNNADGGSAGDAFVVQPAMQSGTQRTTHEPITAGRKCTASTHQTIQSATAAIFTTVTSRISLSSTA
mmetsp:Transcript_2279/g.6809  ORF Transcript_2279/g.6809 Transcript_2279/m.6809 type:complete len:179 (-) Transcript_2279:687-1223(-)